MKIISKKINLKEDTLKDINSNNIDTSIYIQRVDEYLKKAYNLIYNKMIDMDSNTLYNSLKEVFDIKFDRNDYLKIFSLMYQKHYSKYITLNSYDKDNRDSTSYLCAITNKVDYLDGDLIPIKHFRKLVNSNDIILINEKNTKNDKNSSLTFYNIDNCIINEDNQLYPYATMLLKKELIVKNVLFDLKLYVDEVLHQVREINGLALIKDNDLIANIGKQYKNAYDKATNDKKLPKKEKISVRYHQKTKTKKI